MPDYREFISKALTANKEAGYVDKIGLLSDYLSQLLSVNEYMNLTAIKDPYEAAVKNIADCVLYAKYIPKNARLLDIGSGAGLPAFPFAICRPDIRVTALDSTGKKVKFISETAKLLGLDNLNAVCGRAEDVAKDPSYREGFDTVSARAVARLNILSELCLPFVKKGGIFLSMKSRLADEELAEAKRGIKLLGGEVTRHDTSTLLGLSEELTRSAIIIKKVCPCPKTYPRAYKAISSKPL